MKRRIFLIMMGFVFLALSLTLAADIPMMLNYQGYVRYDNGVPVNSNGYFKFAIVNREGNKTYWSNDETSTTGDQPDKAIKIPVTNGVFTVKLGDTDITNMSVLPATAFDRQNIYVRVWFSEDNLTFEQMSPDTQIVSAAFAYKAQSVVDSTVTSTIIQDGAITNADISDTASIAASKINPAGLDADTLDGKDSSSFANSVHTHDNYAGITHNHSGSEITSGTIDNERLDSDLQDLADGSLSASRVQYGTYFIDSAGTNGQVWKSDGSGKGYWGQDNTGGGGGLGLWTQTGSDIYYNSGNVGIGTAVPEALLHLNTNDNSVKMLLTGSNLHQAMIDFQGVPGTIDYRLGKTTANDFIIWRDGHPDFYIKGNGNVGIGTTSPTEKLEVSGIVKATSFIGDGSQLTGISGSGQWSNGTGGIYYNGGNVGIGTISPGAKLHVHGEVLLGEYATQENYRLSLNNGNVRGINAE